MARSTQWHGRLRVAKGTTVAAAASRRICMRTIKEKIQGISLRLSVQEEYNVNNGWNFFIILQYWHWQWGRFMMISVQKQPEGPTSLCELLEQTWMDRALPWCSSLAFIAEPSVTNGLQRERKLVGGASDFSTRKHSRRTSGHLPSHLWRHEDDWQTWREYITSLLCEFFFMLPLWQLVCVSVH